MADKRIIITLESGTSSQDIFSGSGGDSDEEMMESAGNILTSMVTGAPQNATSDGKTNNPTANKMGEILGSDSMGGAGKTAAAVGLMVADTAVKAVKALGSTVMQNSDNAVEMARMNSLNSIKSRVGDAAKTIGAYQQAIPIPGVGAAIGAVMALANEAVEAAARNLEWNYHQRENDLAEQRNSERLGAVILNGNRNIKL